MTELLYHTDSYLQTFEAVIRAVDADNHALILDRTAFYPGGGGQPPDRGELVVEDQPLTVTKAEKVGADVLHFIEGDFLPAVGQRVIGKLDWDYRYPLMRTHTAMHIMCGVAWHDYGVYVTGGNMEPLKCRMDFEFEEMRAELVHEIEARLNEEVAAARDVRVAIHPREEAFKIPDLIRTKINLLPEGIQKVRTVEIVGLDLQADGGTHVHNTAEVGRLRVSDYKSKGKINKRIYVDVLED